MAEDSARAGTTEARGGRGTGETPGIGMAEVSGGRGTTVARLAIDREGRSGGRGTSGRSRPEALARPPFPNDCEIPGQSLKPCMGGCERGNLENAGGTAEKRGTSPRWLNPGLPLWVKPGPRLNPPAREPKELTLCAAQGIPHATMTRPKRSQIRGGILHLLLQPNSLLKA